MRRYNPRKTLAQIRREQQLKEEAIKLYFEGKNKAEISRILSIPPKKAARLVAHTKKEREQALKEEAIKLYKKLGNYNKVAKKLCIGHAKLSKWLQPFFPKKKQWPSFELAKEIVKKASITSARHYEETRKQLGLPASPYKYYPEWHSWQDFLDKEWPTFEEAKQLVRNANIANQDIYLDIRKELGLPSCPRKVYHEYWRGWRDFLGPLEARRLKKKKKLPTTRKPRFKKKLSKKKPVKVSKKHKEHICPVCGEPVVYSGRGRPAKTHKECRD